MIKFTGVNANIGATQVEQLCPVMSCWDTGGQEKKNRFIRLGCDRFPTLLGTVARQNGHPFHNTLASLNK